MSAPGHCAAARVLARTRALIGRNGHAVAAMGNQTGLFIATMHFSWTESENFIFTNYKVSR